MYTRAGAVFCAKCLCAGLSDRTSERFAALVADDDTPLLIRTFFKQFVSLSLSILKKFVQLYIKGGVDMCKLQIGV